MKKQKPTQTFMSKQKYLHGVSLPERLKAALLMMNSDSKYLFVVTNPSHKAIIEKFSEVFSFNCTVRLTGNQITGRRATGIIFDEHYVADTGRMMSHDERLRDAMAHGYKAGLLK